MKMQRSEYQKKLSIIQGAEIYRALSDDEKRRVKVLGMFPASIQISMPKDPDDFREVASIMIKIAEADQTI